MPIIKEYKGITIKRFPDVKTYEAALKAGEIKEGEIVQVEEGDESPVTQADLQAVLEKLQTQGSASLSIDETLKVNEAGALGVNTAKEVERDNTLPITAAAVHTTVGNIEVLLGTI